MSSSAKLIPMVVGLMAIFFNSLNGSELDWFTESQRDLFMHGFDHRELL
jgi:hypothetical protein